MSINFKPIKLIMHEYQILSIYLCYHCFQPCLWIGEDPTLLLYFWIWRKKKKKLRLGQRTHKSHLETKLFFILALGAQFIYQILQVVEFCAHHDKFWQMDQENIKVCTLTPASDTSFKTTQNDFNFTCEIFQMWDLTGKPIFKNYKLNGEF